MKQVFGRGLITGLVGGLGFDLFVDWFSQWELTFRQLLAGLAVGGLLGLLLGVVMMGALLLLRQLDRRTGWSLALRLEHSEPGLLGLLVGLLLTFPGATVGGVSFGVATFESLRLLYASSASEWSFAITAFLGLMVLPLMVLLGVALGAMLGATLGSGLVGLCRGLLRRP